MSFPKGSRAKFEKKFLSILASDLTQRWVTVRNMVCHDALTGTE